MTNEGLKIENTASKALQTSGPGVAIPVDELEVNL
jgi:hypothetical protein